MLANSTHQRLTGAAVRELASEARTRLRLGKGGYRREHVRAFAQHVEVADNAIYIKGSKSTLLRTLVATKGAKSAFPVLYRSGGEGVSALARTYAALTGAINRHMRQHMREGPLVAPVALAIGPRAELDYQLWLSAKGRPVSPASFNDWQHERRIAAGLIFPARELRRAEWRA